MHLLTEQPKTMQIDLWYYDQYAYALYINFAIWNKTTSYIVKFDYFAGGNAGDSFSF